MAPPQDHAGISQRADEVAADRAAPSRAGALSHRRFSFGEGGVCVSRLWPSMALRHDSACARIRPPISADLLRNQGGRLMARPIIGYRALREGRVSEAGRLYF